MSRQGFNLRQLVDDPEFQEKFAQAAKLLRDFDWGPVAASIEAQRDRLKATEFPTDPVDNEWLANLLYVCEIAEIDPTGLSAIDIERKALAWLEREKIKVKLSADASAAAFLRPIADDSTKSVERQKRFKADPCPKCGFKVRVDGTSKTSRHLKCTNPQCEWAATRLRDDSTKSVE